MKKRLYVEMLVIFSMIILCCSVKEIYADDNMDVVCEEKVDTKENMRLFQVLCKHKKLI